jgi:hypothetical protein
MIDDGGQKVGNTPTICIGGLRGNARKSLLLTALLIAFVGIWARMIIGGHTPGAASAQEHQQPAAAVLAAEAAGAAPKTGNQGAASLAQWASEGGSLSRNLFAVPYDQYPMDPSYNPQTGSDTAKSASAQADHLKERQALIGKLRSEAAKLTLEGVVLGASPKAWVSGLLVGVGQPVGQTGFRVTRIEPRRVVIECDGVQLELAMK